MSQSELAQLELDCGALLTPQAPGSTPFTAVKQLAPGVWPWTFILSPANEDAGSCRDFFGAYIWDCSLGAPIAVAEREAAFREIMIGQVAPLHDRGSR